MALFDVCHICGQWWRVPLPDGSTRYSSSICEGDYFEDRCGDRRHNVSVGHGYISIVEVTAPARTKPATLHAMAILLVAADNSEE